MTRIRFVEIENFRAVRQLAWAPGPGLNCLIGPGDSGKTTILDAIEVCLSARRSWNFVDTDFHQLDVSKPVRIRVTLGNLPTHFKDLEMYGEYLRGYSSTTHHIEDEPGFGLEVVLTVELRVEADLEPIWRLYSERTHRSENSRELRWKDRTLIACARLGNHSSSNLSWTRGSVLTRLSEVPLNVGAALNEAAREARNAFGNRADAQLEEVLALVTDKASQLGIEAGQVRALLDAHAVTLSDGAVALHSVAGVPLRSLGTGSTRLLLSALHKEAVDATSALLVDEVEHGLEPHRLIQLLHSLGSKESHEPPMQVFMTSHSAVAVRELSGTQLHIVRRGGGNVHTVHNVGSTNAVQGMARVYPEAFLARTIVVCEGASEIGLLRGLDRYFVSQGQTSSLAMGTAFVDATGGSPAKVFERAVAFRSMGYRTLAFLDADVPLEAGALDVATASGVHVSMWDGALALEEVIFRDLPDEVIVDAVQMAIEFNSEALVDSALEIASGGGLRLGDIWEISQSRVFREQERGWLGKAAKLTQEKKRERPARAGWFKNITKMEELAFQIIGPQYAHCDFRETLDKLFDIVHGRA